MGFVVLFLKLRGRSRHKSSILMFIPANKVKCDSMEDLQESKSSDEEIIAEYRKLSNMLIAHAEPFIKDLEEVQNGTLSFVTVKAANQEWVKEVKQLFFKLTDAEVAPVKVHDWAEAILDLAGWVVDMALFLENADKWEQNWESWTLRSSIKRYQEALNRIGELDQ